MAGPTGSGKSDLCLELDPNLFEVISFDSRQIYKEVPIGTAQPSLELQTKLKHHLVGVLNPSESINAADYIKLAKTSFYEILNSKKIPILTSGTGFYLKAFLYGMAKVNPISPETKKAVEKLSKEEKWIQLQEIDIKASKLLNPNDEYRITRALEISLSGEKWSSLQSQKSGGILEEFPNLLLQGVFIEWDREILYKRINSRCKEMIKNGFLEEIKNLVNTYGSHCPAFNSLGYNFALDYIVGNKNMETFFDEFSRSHRNYAKKQITWFKKEQVLVNKSWKDSLEFIKNIEKRLRNVY